MFDEDEDILSADLIYSDDEILAEFQERCEEAAGMPGNSSPDLQRTAKALISVL